LVQVVSIEIVSDSGIASRASSDRNERNTSEFGRPTAGRRRAW
jgi:hypothetical protein